MYTFLITDNNEMVPSVRERVMQRSNAVDSIRFLVSPTYNDQSMSNYTLTLEYVLPCSKEYRTEILELSADTYQGYLEYKLPVTTKITREPGNIELQITCVWLELTVDGEQYQHIRKISSATLPVIAIKAWSDIIPDDAFTPLDQRLIALQGIANQLADLQEQTLEYVDTKADDISYEDNTLQLMAGGKKIGSKHVLDQQKEFEVVEFGSSSDSSDDSKDDDNEYTLVEF